MSDKDKRYSFKVTSFTNWKLTTNNKWCPPTSGLYKEEPEWIELKEPFTISVTCESMDEAICKLDNRARAEFTGCGAYLHTDIDTDST